jgi:hypothetical protein
MRRDNTDGGRGGSGDEADGNCQTPTPPMHRRLARRR